MVKTDQPTHPPAPECDEFRICHGALEFFHNGMWLRVDKLADWGAHGITKQAHRDCANAAIAAWLEKLAPLNRRLRVMWPCKTPVLSEKYNIIENIDAWRAWKKGEYHGEE